MRDLLWRIVIGQEEQLPSIKYFSSRGGWLWANDVLVPRKVTPGLPRDEVFFTVPRPHFLGLALIWPGYFGEHVLGLLDYILRVCQSLWDSFLYLGKLHWFLYLLLFYFYDPGMFVRIFTFGPTRDKYTTFC